MITVSVFAGDSPQNRSLRTRRTSPRPTSMDCAEYRPPDAGMPESRTSTNGVAEGRNRWLGSRLRNSVRHSGIGPSMSTSTCRPPPETVMARMRS